MLKPLTVWITTNCGKFFKRWEYLTTLPASWKICMQVKKQQLEPDIEQWTGSKLGKEYVKTVYWKKRKKEKKKDCILSPCIFNLYSGYIMWNARLDEAQSGNKITRRNINNLRCADDSKLMGERKEELKSLLRKWKRRVKKLA